MSAKKNHHDNYTKPSKEKQWHERSDAPIATSCMTKAEIFEFKQYLVESYKCDMMDIDYDFEKIMDENDEDRDDCLWLKYKMKCVLAGKSITKVIFSIKIPVPDEIKEKAKQHRRAEAMNSRKRLALPPIPNVSEPTVVSSPDDHKSSANRPKLVRPVKKA